MNNKSLYKQIMELDEITSNTYSSKEAKLNSTLALKQFSKILRKSSFEIIKIMNRDIKSGNYDAMDIQRTINQGNPIDSHPYERDFIENL